MCWSLLYACVRRSSKLAHNPHRRTHLILTMSN
jgi:hypothetical protein